mgnify:CR=1 FL=1
MGRNIARNVGARKHSLRNESSSLSEVRNEDEIRGQVCFRGQKVQDKQFCTA